MSLTKFRNAKLRSSGLIALGMLVIVVGVVATISNARSDSPIPAEKQATHNRFIDPPTRDPSLPAVLATKPFDTPAGTPIPQPTGVTQGCVAPYPASEFRCKNSWKGNIDSLTVLVYAGSAGRETRDPDRGILFVDTYSDETPGGSYEAPNLVGALRIVGNLGSVLTISSETGETFYFDAATRAFTDENGNPVPTDSPTPTYPPHTPGPTISPDPETDTPTPTAAPTFAPTAAPTAAAGN